MHFGRVLGFLVLGVFLTAVVFSLLSASGRSDLIDKLEAGEQLKISEDKPDEVEEPQEDYVLTADDIPITYKIESPDFTNLHIIKNAKPLDIKRLIIRDIPVIALVDSEKLKNPFYTEEGHVYLTITGFTTNHFEALESSREDRRVFNYLISDFMQALEVTGGDVMYAL